MKTYRINFSVFNFENGGYINHETNIQAANAEAAWNWNKAYLKREKGGINSVILLNKDHLLALPTADIQAIMADEAAVKEAALKAQHKAEMDAFFAMLDA